MPTTILRDLKKTPHKKAKTAEKTPPRPIPESFAHEKINGIPIYYHGFQEVVNGAKQAEEIMGSSFLQSVLISRIIRFLMAHLPTCYEVLTNELGLQFSKGNWCAADIAIYAAAQLQQIPLHNKYLNIPPKVVIEIDTKAEPAQFLTMMDYYYTKTDALLDFGVEKIVWISTDARKVMIAEPHKDWITRNWDQEIPIFENVALNLTELLSENRIETQFL